MYLYVCDSYGEKKEGRQRLAVSESLVLDSAKMYIIEERMRLGTASGQILRTPKGKPYFKDVPLEFSVSHTGGLWVCLIDRSPVGVDIQEIRKCQREKIARRYYTPDEQEYAAAMGEAGFFQIWARKEAYVKYTGEGLNEDIKFFSTLKSDNVEFIDFDLCEGVKGSCCMKEMCELWIRKIK